MLYNQSKYSLAWPWNFGNSSSKTRVFVLSDHVSSGSDLNAPLGQLLEPISSSETRDVKPGLERKSSNLAISVSDYQDSSCTVLPHIVWYWQWWSCCVDLLLQDVDCNDCATNGKIRLDGCAHLVRSLQTLVYFRSSYSGLLGFWNQSMDWEVPRGYSWWD